MSDHALRPGKLLVDIRFSMVLHQYITSLAIPLLLIYHFLLTVRSLVQLSFYLDNLRLPFVLRLSDVAHAAMV